MIKKLVLLLVLQLILVGCSNRDEAETVTICEIDNLETNGIVVDSILEAVGDRLFKMDEVNHLSLEKFTQLLGTNAEELLEMWEENPNNMEETFLAALQVPGTGTSLETLENGITTEVDVTDTLLIIRTVIKFDEISPNELEYLVREGMVLISLNETIERIESKGGTCTQQ